MSRATKIIIVIVFALSSAIQLCDKEINFNQTLQSEYFTHIKTFHISEANPIFQTRPVDAVMDSLGNIYFTNFFDRTIKKSKPPFTSYEIIGRNGQGPGEYIQPAYLVLKNNVLYFSDTSNNFIKSILLNAANSRHRSFELSVRGGSSKFDVGDSLIAVFNKRPPHLSIYSYTPDNHTELIQEELQFDDIYKPMQNLNGGGVQIDNSGRIYVMPVAPYELNKYSTENSASGARYFLSEESYFEHLPKYIKWDRKKYLQGLDASDDKRHEILNSFTKIYNFFIIQDTSNNFFIEILDRTHNIHQASHIFHLISQNGKLLATYELSDTSVLAVYKNMFYTYTLTNNDSKREVIIDLYKFEQ